MLNEHLAAIDYRQHDDQPDLDEEIQLLSHGASPSVAPLKSDTSRGHAIKLQVTQLNSDLVARPKGLGAKSWENSWENLKSNLIACAALPP
jgi:hypothetical protein